MVLSREEVNRILGSLYRFQYQTCLTTIYGCGLRIGEALRLEVGDVDSDRMLLRVRQGKGAKDRYVPLPQAVLLFLRQNWATHRHPRLLFPSRRKRHISITPSGVKRALDRALVDSGVQKAVTPHTFRHSYATHLLESGVSLRAIQIYLGHSSIQSTMVYTHLTKPMENHAIETINGLIELPSPANGLP